MLRSKVGSTIDILIDEVDEDGAIGRSNWDAPEIDGQRLPRRRRRSEAGDMVRGKIVEADDYDLWAERE